MGALGRRDGHDGGEVLVRARAAVRNAVRTAPSPDAPDGVPKERVIEHATRESIVSRPAARRALEQLDAEGTIYRAGDRYKETNR